MVKYSSLGGMAQLVEHSLHMRGVTGSSPVVSTNKNAHQLGCAFLFIETTKGRESENLFSAFGGCLQPLALCTVYIVADTLCRCVVYSFLHYAEQPLLSFVSPTGSNSGGFTAPVQNCTSVTKVTLHAIDLW